MPPASLSTLAVMMPGPITARTSTRRIFHDRRRVSTGASVGPAQDVDYVIGGGDVPQPSPVPPPRESQQGVLFSKARPPLLSGVPAGGWKPGQRTGPGAP